MDDLLGDIISSLYQISEDEVGAVIKGFTLTTDYLSFDPVEVPPVPEAVLEKAWGNAGFSAN